MNKTVLLMLIISFSISAQGSKSIHQIERDYYSKVQPDYSSVKKSLIETRLPKNFGSTSLNKTVFGFLPWWEYLIVMIFI